MTANRGRSRSLCSDGWLGNGAEIALAFVFGEMTEPWMGRGYYEGQMTSLLHHPSLTAAHGVAAELPSVEPVSLLARLRAGDQAALAQLTRAYGAALTRAAYLHMGDGHAAEDATQDALLAAWDGARRTTERTPLWPWLLGITFNCCRKHLRSLSRRRRREHHAHELKLVNASDESNGQQDDRLTALRQALLQLTEPLRCVVILRYEQSLSVAETAEALGLPEGTVKRRCHDAIAKLRQLMDEATRASS